MQTHKHMHKHTQTHIHTHTQTLTYTHTYTHTDTLVSTLTPLSASRGWGLRCLLRGSPPRLSLALHPLFLSWQCSELVENESSLTNYIGQSCLCMCMYMFVCVCIFKPVYLCSMLNIYTCEEPFVCMWYTPTRRSWSQCESESFMPG